MMDQLTKTILFHCVFFIMGQLIHADLTGLGASLPSNVTGDSCHERSGRAKRSLFDTMPAVLKLQVKMPSDGSVISLQWNKQRSFLANEYLPIVSINEDTYPDVMADIGEMVAYHDFHKSSAVIYYKKSNTLSGFIDVAYSITNLPFNFAEGEYQGPDPSSYLNKFEGSTDGHIIPDIPEVFWDENFLQLDVNDSNKVIGVLSDSDSDSEPLAKKQRRLYDPNYGQGSGGSMTGMGTSNDLKTRIRRESAFLDFHYLEILVVITRNVADELYLELCRFIEPTENDDWDFVDLMYHSERFDTQNYIQEIVKKTINYFNAVDMLFRKIQGRFIKVYMNLAKIIIENDLDQFGFHTEEVLDFPSAVLGIREHMLVHEDIYTPDSFDYLFMFTNLPIAIDERIESASTDRDGRLYNSRKKGLWYIGFPITIIQENNNYPRAVHEISRTFHIDIQPWDVGLTPLGQCHSIMQRGSSKCEKCLKWREEDSEKFRTFFTTNVDRCFLLNEPRSLQPLGPRKFLSPLMQCRCYGYYSYTGKSKGTLTRANVLSDECDEPLKCQTDEQNPTHFEFTLKPFDGTLCSDRGKVCWNQKCEVLPKATSKKT